MCRRGSEGGIEKGGGAAGRERSVREDKSPDPGRVRLSPTRPRVTRTRIHAYIHMHTSRRPRRLTTSTQMHAQKQTQERICADAFAQAQGAGSQVQAGAEYTGRTSICTESAQHRVQRCSGCIQLQPPPAPSRDGDLQRLLARPHAEGDNLFREDIFNKK